MKLLRYSLCVPALVATAHATQFMSTEQAQRGFFPAADSFLEKKLDLSADQLAQIEARSRTRVRLKRFRVWEALAQGHGGHG